MYPSSLPSFPFLDYTSLRGYDFRPWQRRAVTTLVRARAIGRNIRWGDRRPLRFRMWRATATMNLKLLMGWISGGIRWDFFITCLPLTGLADRGRISSRCDCEARESCFGNRYTIWNGCNAIISYLLGYMGENVHWNFCNRSILHLHDRGSNSGNGWNLHELWGARCGFEWRYWAVFLIGGKWPSMINNDVVTRYNEFIYRAIIFLWSSVSRIRRCLMAFGSRLVGCKI